MPELSVVIPALDDRGHLRELMFALEAQRQFIGEVIISHSGVGNPMPALSESRIPIRYLHHSAPLYSGTARNCGAKEARGNSLAFLDDDVIPADDWAASVCNHLAEAKTDTCFVGAIAVDKPGGYWGMCLWFIEFGSVHPYMPARRQEGGASANMFAHKALFTRCGGFPEQVSRSVDVEFMARCRGADGTTRFEPAAVVGHRNISGKAHCLRHAQSLGNGSARVRKMAAITGDIFVRYPWCAPLLFPLRLGLLGCRVIRWGRGHRLSFVRHLPGIVLALLAWTRGFYRSASHCESPGGSPD
jgi:hypothetical protein